MCKQDCDKRESTIEMWVNFVDIEQTKQLE